MLVRKENISFIHIWLLSLIFLIFLIILIGGLTRLTGSGLSMVDWNLFMGTIPPLSEGAWIEVFNNYKTYPEYIHVNSSMVLSEFKTIFLWEYVHRMLGRLIGLVILGGLIFIIFNRQLYKKFVVPAIIMTILVISQGLLGWYMVKSGLIDIPRVSHFRLASHLSFALILLQYIVWTYLSINKTKLHISKLALACIVWTFGICFQIIYGAFTSGLKAGWGYNTYPLMGGEFLPKAAFMFSSFFENLFYNPVMIQFIHRHFPIFLVVSFCILGVLIFKYSNSKVVRNCTLWTSGILTVQILLGIFTLLMIVPIYLASLHQMVGVFLLTSSVMLCFYSLHNLDQTIKN